MCTLVFSCTPMPAPVKKIEKKTEAAEKTSVGNPARADKKGKVNKAGGAEKGKKINKTNRKPTRK